MTDTLTAVSIDEVQVVAKNVTRDDDHLNIIPTTEQKEHAQTGYAFLASLMIPGMSIGNDGSVNTMGMATALYINGLPADVQDIVYLQPNDVIRVEYYDTPKGKYSKDLTAVNFVVRQYKYGGYVQASAEQKIGFDSGNYGLASSISKGTMTYSFIGGYSYSSINGNNSSSVDEYILPDKTVTRKSLSSLRSRSKGEYAQFRTRCAKEGMYIVGKLSLSGSQQPYSEITGIVEDNQNNRTDYISCSSDRSLSPRLDLNGRFSLGEGRSLTVGLHGTYSRNSYNRTYIEQPYQYLTSDKEHVVISKASAIYQQKLGKGQLSAQLFNYFDNYKTDYDGTYELQSRLWKNETLAFIIYNYPFSEHITLMTRIGADWYKFMLKGSEKYETWNPRLNLNLTRRSSNSMLSATFMLANSTYGMDIINDARISVNPYMIRQGNPNIRKAYDTDSRIYYSLQKGKWNMSALARFIYNFNPVTYNYSQNNGYILQSFVNDGNNRQFSTMYAATYKASKSLSFTGNMNYAHTQVNVGGHWRHNNFTGGLAFQWYFKCFAFSGGMNLASSYFSTYTLMESKMPFSYNMQVSYSHKGLRMSAATTMPFNKATFEYTTQTPFYMSNSSLRDRQQSQFCSISLSYTFRFGKEIEREDKDVDTNVKSAILRDK